MDEEQSREIGFWLLVVVCLRFSVKIPTCVIFPLFLLLCVKASVDSMMKCSFTSTLFV